MGPTQDIKHIVGKLRISDLYYVLHIWCGGSWGASNVTKVENSLPRGIVFVVVLISFLDFYKKSALKVSFLKQKNY